MPRPAGPDRQSEPKRLARFLYGHFPSTHLSGHTATFAFDHTHGKRFTRLQICQTRATQNLDMHEDILVTAERIGKTEALTLIEPFHSRRLQWSRAHHLGIDLIEIGQTGAFHVIRRLD